MILENQVCSLEFAKRLYQLGVKQDGAFNYADTEDGVWAIAFKTEKEEDPIVGFGPELEEGEDGGYFDAFTVAELGELISSCFNEWSQGWNDSGCFWHFQAGDRGSGNMIEGFGIKFSALDLEEDTEANARAAFLIYLIENQLIDPSTLCTKQEK